jgi:hypothetical protein
MARKKTSKRRRVPPRSAKQRPAQRRSPRQTRASPTKKKAPGAKKRAWTRAQLASKLRDSELRPETLAFLKAMATAEPATVYTFVPSWRTEPAWTQPLELAPPLVRLSLEAPQAPHPAPSPSASTARRGRPPVMSLETFQSHLDLLAQLGARAPQPPWRKRTRRSTWTLIGGQSADI